MIGQDLDRYFEMARSGMLHSGRDRPYDQPTPCATCKFAVKGLPDMAHFMTHCTVHTKPTHQDDVPLHSNLVHTHVRVGMDVPELRCNFHKRRENS